MGEKQYKNFLLAIRRKGDYSSACYCMGLSGFFLYLVGFLLIILSPKESWPFYIGFGIEVYAIVILLYEYIYNRKLFKASVIKPYELIVRKVED